MLPQGLFIFVSTLTVAFAASIRRATKCVSNNDTITATLPSTGTATELPAPPSDLTLKYITVGHGIQNYSCSAIGATAVSGGALAVLYDITNLYSRLSQEELTQLPVDLLRTTDIPLNLVSTGVTPYSADVADPFKADAAVDVDNLTLEIIGHHYFDTALVPTFDLYTKGSLLKGAKTGDVKPPATADPGLLNTGAVDWLQLGDKGAGTSVGLNMTYRVVTAGGNFMSCNCTGETFSVPYAAQYWFYV